MKVIKLLILCSLPFLVSCSFQRKEENIVKYSESEKSGLHKVVTIGECVFSFQYKPAAYILEAEHLQTPEEIQKRKQQLDSMVWFNISISIKEQNQSPLRYKINGLPEYEARLNYYLNEAAGDLLLTTGSDTLFPVAYWFENNHNLTPKETMVVGFRLPFDNYPAHDLHLSYYDRVFKSGIIKVLINKKDIDKIYNK